MPLKQRHAQEILELLDVMADGVTASSSAPSAKLPRRAAASNARSALSGGKRDFVVLLLELI
jgi:hypothetical protein